MAEKKLSVKNLRISFRTSNGKVQAVRGIDFDLYKGETLAIVGESGSGKSVTSRALMGILAGNAIVEGGKILYGDKDLLKISEEEFHKIRGDKIAMVFQDPLSSLNPIMKVGQQLTEAMLLKNKASRKESRVAMEKLLSDMEKSMQAAGVSNAKEQIATFRKFEPVHCKLQSEYSDSLAAAQDAVGISEQLLLKLNNKNTELLSSDLYSLKNSSKLSVSYFVVRERKQELDKAWESIRTVVKEAKKTKDFTELIKRVETVRDVCAEACTYPVPDTFALGYYLTYVDKQIPKLDVEELNRLTSEKQAPFMKRFREDLEKGCRYSEQATNENRSKAIALIDEKIDVFRGKPEESAVKDVVAEMKKAFATCIDPLEVVKDSITHTFDSSIDYAVDLYFNGTEKNAAEEKRYASEKAKYDKLVEKGKTPTWEIIPASFIDLDKARQDMEDTVSEMRSHFEAQLAEHRSAEKDSGVDDRIAFLKEKAQDSVYKITKSMAKERAIKLMENVGIDNPRRRFQQYPFEFSGGMRQRIVIAIALTANPDVLICDEPTTALDVTIQAQILELINKIKRERNLSVIFITHDLGVVANMADRIAVMYAGKIVEYGTATDVFYSPAHPYTWALLSSIPDLDTKERLESIPGTPPNMIYPPKGDAFADRNKYALAIDFEEQPPMFEISETHYAATWLLHPYAPKIDPPKIVTERIRRMKEKRGETQ